MATSVEVAQALGIVLQPMMAVVITHEVGHILGPVDAELERQWRNAVAKDLNRTTPYGTSSIPEEIAEVYKVYAYVVGTPAEARWRERWPGRFAVLDAMSARASST